jgi:tetratricopeptide (TPR) repeat protein
MRAGKLSEAQAILEQALLINPICFDSLVNVAACLVTREKSPERAEQLLRHADALRPDDQAVWTNLGRALALQGKQAEADKAYRHAIRINPQAEVVQLIKAFCPHLANVGINS